MEKIKVEKEKATILQKLLKIQGELKAPKGQVNNFGKYKYRSCEDILESVKPLCVKNNVTLILSDDLVMIGDRYYVKATAQLTDVETKESIAVNSFAREEVEKKGMDASQITGASSSYARKYALNGLFNIDDTKDSDATNDGILGKKPIEMVDPKIYSDKVSLASTRESLNQIYKEVSISQKITSEQKSDIIKQIKTKVESLTPTAPEQQAINN